MTAVFALLVLAVIGGAIVIYCAERPARGKHAMSAPAADPEPARLPAAGQLPMLADEQWWGVPPPQPSVVEVITGPGLVLNVLGRVRDSLRELPPADATLTAAGADDTRADLPPVTSQANLIARYLP